MAASTLTTTNFSNDTDPHFRAWGSAMDAAIIAGGWVNNGDSGQIDFATVLAPVALNTSQGYKIYRSNDGGGGLDQFYIKLEFGSGGSNLRPSLWITAGFQGTDGAGNLLSTINPVSTRTQITTGLTPAGASQSINFASGSGYFVICCSGATSTESIILSVERTKDVNLAFMNQVLIIGSIAGAVNNSGGYNQVINKLNAFIAASGGNVFSIPPNANTPIAGVVGLGLMFGMAVGATSPSLNLFGVEDTALGIYQDTITVPVIGVNHNYKLQRGVSFCNQVSTVFLSRFE